METCARILSLAFAFVFTQLLTLFQKDDLLFLLFANGQRNRKIRELGQTPSLCKYQ